MAKTYIYGMGKRGIHTYLLLKENGEMISAFIDADPEKQGRKIDNIGCVSPEWYKENSENDDLVIVAIDNVEISSISERLNTINVIYFREIEKKLKRHYTPIKDMKQLEYLLNRYRDGGESISNECITG